MKRKHDIYIIPFLLVTAIIVTALYPHNIEYTLGVVGKLLPRRDISVYRTADGVISVVNTDHIEGVEKSNFVSELLRGDTVEFRLGSSIVPGNNVSAGDTLCWIDSHEIIRELDSLEGELLIEKAALEVLLVGEKSSVIDEARSNLEAIRENVNELSRIAERQKELQGSGFLTYQEYELTLSQLEIGRNELKRAEAQLATVQTGSKQEEVNLAKAKINHIEQQINNLREKLSRMTVILPFSGQVVDNTSGSIASGSGTVVAGSNTMNEGYIATVCDQSMLCVIMQVKIKNIPYIKLNQKVELAVEGADQPLHGIVTSIGNMAQVMHDEQTVQVTATLDPGDYDVPVGMICMCDIYLEPVTLFEYFKRSINTVFNR